MFDALDHVYEKVFAARHDLQYEETVEVANIVTDFIHLWINLSHELQLTRPLKLHVLAAHVVDLTMEHRANRRFSVSKMVRAATE